MPLHISCPNTSCELFADDCTLHTAGRNLAEIQSSLQSSVNEVSNWCQTNSMLIHPQKTKCMVLCTRQKRERQKRDLAPLLMNISINSVPIEQVSNHRLLGIIIDEDFQWENQITNMCKKLSQNLFLMSKLRHFVNTKTLKLFFYAHIKSHIDYASPVWDGCSQNHLDRVVSLYRRSAKFLLPDPAKSTDEKMKDLEMLPLHKQLQLNKGIFMFKILSNNAPSYLCNLFTPAQQRYENSRSDLRARRPRIDLTMTRISYSGAVLWNSLPNELKKKSIVSSFKKDLKKYLLVNDLKLPH